MVAITEEREKKEHKEKRGRKREGKERRIVEGKLPRHRGGKRDKLSRFFLSLRPPPHGREYKQVFPGRISLLGPQKIYDNSDVPPCARERENRAEKWREKRRRKKGRKRGGNREGREVATKLCRARCRSIPRENAFGFWVSLCSGMERMRATIPRYDN